MNLSSQNRCRGIDSFIVCFYCNETFRSLSYLLRHCCSSEENNILYSEPLETFSDIDVDDLEQEYSVENTEAVPENPPEVPRNEITESEITVKSVFETSLSEIPTDAEQPLLGTKSDEARQENTELASDLSEKQLLEVNSVEVKEVTNLSYDAPETQPDVSEKLMLEANSDGVKEATNLSYDAPQKQYDESKIHLLSANSDAVKEVTNLSYDAPEKSTLSSNSIAVAEKIDNTKAEPKHADDSNRVSSDLVSKVLHFYKIKLDSSESCCKSPTTQIEFQSSHSPLPVKECDSSRHDDTQIECSTIKICKESEEKMECFASNTCNIPPSSNTETETSPIANMIKSTSSNNDEEESSSLEINFDSTGYGDDSVAHDDSSTEKMSNIQMSNDHVQAELHASEITNKSLSKKKLDITKYGSITIKPCYVEVRDIFKSVSKTSLNSENIVGQKKKYHVCDVCYKFFRLRSDLNIHYLIHTVVKPYVCNICDKSFLKQCNLFAHHLTHVIKKRHKCSVCKKEFAKESILLRHKSSHSKEKPFSCEICSKTFSLKSSLKEHYLSHSNEKPFVCEICSAAYSNKRYLRKHYLAHQRKKMKSASSGLSLSHSNKIPFVCEICHKSFSHVKYLRKHYYRHQKNVMKSASSELSLADSTEKPFVCEICSKSFSQVKYLRKHYDRHQRNVMKSASSELNLPSLKEMSHVCKICQAAFKDEISLREHYYSHPPKIFVCEFCYKTFKFKNHLDEHYNIHTNNRPYECKICSKSFHWLLSLNKHYSTAHRNERNLMPPERIKTFSDNKTVENPFIQKIEKSAVVDKSEKAPLVQKIEKSSIVQTSKEPVLNSTRRKSFIPRKYLQPD